MLAFYAILSRITFVGEDAGVLFPKNGGLILEVVERIYNLKPRKGT